MCKPPPKVAFVNLPHNQPIVRRYMCSYYSPYFYFPPYDLLQLATCAREWNHAEVAFLDCIAEGVDEAGLHAFLARNGSEIVVALVGIESVSADLACLDRVKAALPEITTVIFGYFPTVLSETVLEKTRVDLILRNEPEESFGAYLTARSEARDIAAIPGLAGRDAAGRFFVNPEGRLRDLDRLPFADYALIDINKYEEPWIGGPWGAIFSARGCPFNCAFCIRTFGREVVAKKTETVLAEMKSQINAGIRVIRFVDDTFTLNRNRVIEICQGIVREKIKVAWVCLAHINTLDEEMLSWMKKAGCVRLLVGIESYSAKVLKSLDKRIDPAKTNARLQLIRKVGIESGGFVIVGAPEETEEDFELTLRGLLHAPLDHIILSICAPYVGTPFFESVKEELVFSLIPYECRFRDPRVAERAVGRERRLYMRFYLRPAMLIRHLPRILRYPYRFLRYFLMIVRFNMSRRKGDHRADLF